MTKPNIVVIMADQLKATALREYGNQVLSTPHLSRLARQGALFSHAFTVYPVCVPSRCSFFTGRYPHAHGSVLNAQLLASQEISMVDVLAGHGYETALCGKNHCFREQEKERLFSYRFEAGHIGAYGDFPDEEIVAGRRFQQSVDLQFGAYRTGVNPAPAAKCTSALVTDAALDFLDARERDKPFFLWLSYPDPHSPYQAPEPYASLYRPEDVVLPPQRPEAWGNKPRRQSVARTMFGMDEATEEGMRRVIAMYYGMIAYMDHEIGRFLNRLEAESLLEDTMIVFLSDHGDYMGEHGMVRKSNALYDCLVRIPLIFHWPSHIRPLRSDALVETIDIMPTLLALAGLPLPKGVQGSSIADCLTGGSYRSRHAVFAEVGCEGEPVHDATGFARPEGPEDGSAVPWGGRVEAWKGKGKMIRTMDWKLVYYLNGEGELYHLANDPHELVNLYQEHDYAAIRNDLQNRLLQWCISSEDPLPGVDEQSISFNPH